MLNLESDVPWIILFWLMFVFVRLFFWFTLKFISSYPTSIELYFYFPCMFATAVPG